MLKSELAFPLLRKLSDIGDVNAKKAFKQEIAKRFLSNFSPVQNYLIEEGFLRLLSNDEVLSLLDDPQASILISLKKKIKIDFEVFSPSASKIMKI